MGENATLEIKPFSTAGSSRTSRPVAASHRRTLLPLAAAISWPSGEKRATRDQPVRSNGRMAAPAFSRSQTLAVLSALVVMSRLPSHRKTDALDRPLMALERQERRALRVQLLSVRPDLDRPLGVGRGQPASRREQRPSR